MKNSVPQAAPLAVEQSRRVVKSPPDFAISYHGTVPLFHPLSNRADDWLRLHCPPDGEHRYLGNALAIEHRFVAEIVQFAMDDGLCPENVNRGRE